jgi:hypothetical protein
MAGNDELIYRIKFELPDESIRDAEESFRELEETLDSQPLKNLKDATIEYKTSMEELNESQLEGIERLIELREAIDEYRASLKEIRDAKRENVELSDEQKEAEAQIRAALRNTNQEYRNAEKELIANTLAAEGVTKSYNQLREENKQLETAMRNIPLDDTSGLLQELKERVAENRETMKEFNAEIGDHSMNVGNYSEAMSTAASAVAAFQGPLGPIAGRISSLNTTIQRAIPLIKSKAAAWGAVRLALISTGIGAIIVALGTLIAALSTMQPVLDEVTKRWQQLGAIWGKIRDEIGAVFRMNERSNVSMRESIRIAGELADAQVALDEKRIDSITTIAELNKEIAELRLQAEDETLSHRERINAMEDAEEAVKSMMRIQIEQAEEERRIAEERANIARNERSDDEAVQEARAAVIRLREQENTQLRQITRRRQSIINQLRVEEERRRANAEAIREEARAMRESAQEREQAIIASGEETLMQQRHRRRVEMLRSTEREMTAIAINAEFQREQIRREANAQIEQAEEESLKLQEAIYKELMIDGRLSAEEARRQAKIEAEERLTDEIAAIQRQRSDLITNINEDEQARLTAILNEQEGTRQNIRDQVASLRAEQELQQTALEISLRKERNRELVELELRQQAREEELRREFIEKEFSEEEAARLARSQSELEFERQIQDTKTRIREMALQDRLDLEEAYAELTIGMMQLAFGDAKEVQVATALIDTYTAANRALAQGGVLGVVNAAAITAQGLANVRRIMETEIGDSTSSSGASATSLSSPLGFETISVDDDASVARQVAERSGDGSDEPNVNVYLQGDLNKEILSIKARQGNRTINTKTLTTKSQPA